MYDIFKLKETPWSPWLIQTYFSAVRVRKLLKICFGLKKVNNMSHVLMTDGAALVVDCPTGYFNENCTGVCHCLNGPSQCTQDSGICLDYQCDRGWMDSPYCQTGKDLKTGI